MTSTMSRRRLLLGAAGAGGLMVLSAGGALAKTGRATKLVMHRNAGCGCCLKWADAARAAGFEVSVVSSPDIMAFKAKQGVPDALASCHTTLADGYVIEGHVPLDAVKRLLTQRPKIKGIAVAGMPVGAPGMEVPSGAKQPFEVMAFDSAGKVSRFG
jgi:hypothetical protein